MEQQETKNKRKVSFLLILLNIACNFKIIELSINHLLACHRSLEVDDKASTKNYIRINRLKQTCIVRDCCTNVILLCIGKVTEKSILLKDAEAATEGYIKLSKNFVYGNSSQKKFFNVCKKSTKDFNCDLLTSLTKVVKKNCFWAETWR